MRRAASLLKRRVPLRRHERSQRSVTAPRLLAQLSVMLDDLPVAPGADQAPDVEKFLRALHVLDGRVADPLPPARGA
jgi:hypothetical protein